MLNWIFAACVAYKNLVQTGKKNAVQQTRNFKLENVKSKVQIDFKFGALPHYHKNGISLTSRLILHVHKQILPLFRMILPTIGHQQFGYISVNNQMKQNRYMLCKRFYRATISLRLVTNAHSLTTNS